MAEHNQQMQKIVQKAWDNRFSLREYFLQAHIDTLADKVLKKGGYSGEIYWLTADEINALILLLMKELESKTDKELI
jgi:hypothetical protein